MTLPKLQCVICFSAAFFTELAALSCGHTFHLRCIREWLENRTQCPVCRKEMPENDLLTPLAFRILDSDSYIINSYYRMMQIILLKNANLLFRSSDLCVAYLSRKIQAFWLLEEMKKLELINVKKEIACFVCSRNLHLTNIAALRCGHTFHPQCISPLVKIDKKCPMCKKEAEEDSIIPRLFVEIKEKDDDSSNINDTEEREMSTEILDALDEMEVQIRLIYVQIKHNIALMEMLKKRIESCFEIWRWTL